MKKILFFLLPLVMIYACTATPENDIKEVVGNYYRKGAFNGAILVAKAGKIICDTVLGYKDLKRRLPLDKNTSFYIASLTKPFTALAMMQLKTQHKIRYSDYISNYISGLPAFANDITIQQLLTHTSGIPDYEKEMPSVKGLSNKDVLQWVYTRNKLNFDPGKQYEYSNTGYILLALIIEKISGRSYADFLKMNIFDPVHLTNTIVYDTTKPLIIDRAIGYHKDGTLDDYSLLTTGDGGIFSTTNDLFKWEQALYNGTLLQESEMQDAYKAVKLPNGNRSNYGYGWDITRQDNHKIVSHTGGLNGYRASIWRDLDNKTVIIVLTNQGDAFPLQQFMKDIQEKL